MHDGLEYFLTYADNNAVGYFEKQGFTKEVTMDRERVRTLATVHNEGSSLGGWPLSRALPGCGEANASSAISTNSCN